MSLTNPFAVYVHWPFCLSKCPYCDFNSHVRHGGYDEARYVRAIEAELAERKVPDTDAARAATFHCVLALAWPDEHVELVHGTVDGRIVWPPRGTGGHGYDPCFQPVGEKRTTAEMSEAEKNAISHRGRAFRKLVEQCFQ